MRNFKRILVGLAAGGCLLAGGCLGTFAPMAAGRVAMNTGLLGGVVSETNTTLINLIPIAEIAAILANQPVQNVLCQGTGCTGAGIGHNNTGF